MRAVRSYLVALAFLTRLAPGRVCSPEALAASIRYYPLVGLTLGGLIAGPLALGLFAGRPWIQAWLAVAASLWLTRGLHWDGLMDVADAWGSGARGERFSEILKDSRVGAFAVMACAMGVAGQLLLFHELAEAGDFGALGLAFVLGRFAPVALGRAGRHLARPGLGRLFLAGADTPTLAVTAVQFAALGLLVVSPGALVVSLGITAAGLWGLLSLAKREGMLNGDFLGAAVIWGELAACLGRLLAG